MMKLLTTQEKAMIIGKRLSDLRKSKNLKIKDVAADLCMTPAAISNYENGLRIPRDEAKISLAKYYKVDLESLFYTF